MLARIVRKLWIWGGGEVKLLGHWKIRMYIGIVEVDWVYHIDFHVLLYCLITRNTSTCLCWPDKLEQTVWYCLFYLQNIMPNFTEHIDAKLSIHRYSTAVFDGKSTGKCVSMHFLYSSLYQILTQYKANPPQRKTSSQGLICHYKQMHYKL